MVLQWLSNDYIIRLHPQLSNASPMIQYQLIILRSQGPTPFPVASALYRDLGWDHVVDCYPSPQVLFSLKSLEESEDFEETTTSSISRRLNMRKTTSVELAYGK